jgi:uncharacterized phage-associated protein
MLMKSTLSDLLPKMSYCLWCTAHTDSDTIFTSTGKGRATKIVEVTVMECPWIFTWYQRAEYTKQRSLIAEQLENIDFSSSK